MRYLFRAIVFASLVCVVSFGWPTTSAAQQGGGGYLGAAVGPGGDRPGVVVKEVNPGGPAAAAGLKAGDRVTKVGDTDVKDVDAFRNAVAAAKAGDKLTLTVDRDGKPETLTAAVGERPKGGRRPELLAPQEGRQPAFLGVQMGPLTPELRKQLGVDGESGVVVVEVVQDSPAAKAGLRKDDVITAANGHPIKSPEDLRDEVQAAGAGKELTLTVARGEEKLTLKATPQAGTPGFFLTPGTDPFPFLDVGPMFDQGRRVRELERRVAELEKRMRELEQKPNPAK